MASIILAGSTSGSVTLSSPAVSGTTTLTLPTTTDTLVGKTTTDTLTNKTLTSPTIDGTPTGVGVLTSGTAVASTSGTSIDFTSIPSWVKRITLIFNSVSTSGNSVVQVQIGSGSATTTGYVSSCVNAYGTNLTSVRNSTTGFTTENGNSGLNRSGHMVITNVSGNIWISSCYFGGLASGTPNNEVGGGVLTLSGTLDRVRFTTVNGTDTFDAGSVNILYE